MTPGARLAAAIDVLDAVLRGAPAERALLRWSRGARYAGSKDRAAVRDLVFDALRRLRSSAWLGGQGARAVAAMEARAVIAGLLRGRGEDPAAWFGSGGHAPPALAPGEAEGPALEDAPDAVRADLPDWLWQRFRAGLGDGAAPAAAALRERAPVHLRANLARVSREALSERLAARGLDVAPHPAAPGAIAVDGAPRGLDRMPEFAQGLFEMQDAGSQALVHALPLHGVERVLDLCAGGGGKALALAARAPGLVIDAHDADPKRLAALPPRAERAGAAIRCVEAPRGPYDLVIADVPCSGSGAWRRTPEARWRLTEARLEALVAIQADIVARAAALTRPGGVAAYMTCSVLPEENAPPHPSGWRHDGGLRTRPGGAEGTDGFFLAVLRAPGLGPGGSSVGWVGEGRSVNRALSPVR